MRERGDCVSPATRPAKKSWSSARGSASCGRAPLQIAASVSSNSHSSGRSPGSNKRGEYLPALRTAQLQIISS
jgi:hypothetical protein